MANKLIDALQMTVTDSADCEKKFDFTLPAADVAKTAANVLRELSNYVQLPGFRRGKAPMDIVRKRYENELKEEFHRQVFSTAADKISNADLDVVSWARPEEGELDFAKDYTFSMTVSLAPEFELGEYKGLEVKVPATKVDEKQIDERMDYYRQMYANYADIDTPAEENDLLKVSYESDFATTEETSPAVARLVKSDSNYIWLSNPEMIPGAIAALTGATAGGEYEFKAEFPADFREAELAGKSVSYKVKVQAVQRREMLSDEALCEKLNVKDIAELRDSLTKMAEAEADNARKAKVQEEVYDALSAKVAEFALPKALIAGEEERELRRIANTEIKSEDDVEKFKAGMEEHRKVAEEQALKKLRRVFILRKIAKLENITISNREVDEQLANMSRYYGYKEKDLRKMLTDNGGIEELQLEILSAKVVEFLANEAKISE